MQLTVSPKCSPPPTLRTHICTHTTLAATALSLPPAPTKRSHSPSCFWSLEVQMCLMRLKIKELAGLRVFWRLQERLCCLSFPASRGCSHAWSVTPSRAGIALPSASAITSPLSHPPASLRGPVLIILHWAHLVNLGCSISRSLT